MAGKSSIVKKDAKTRKAIKQSLIDGVPVRTIAVQSGTSTNAVQRYKAKVQKDIAEKAAAEADETYQMHKKSLNTMNEMMDTYNMFFRSFCEKAQAGDKGAKEALKQMIDIGRELRPLAADLAKMTGDIKETTEVNNRPALIVAQISQIIQTSDIKDREAILDRLRIVADR